MERSQRHSWLISAVTQQIHQVIDSAFEEAAALQRQAVVQEEHTAKLDQTPRAILCFVIWHEHEHVVGNAEW